MKNILVVDNDKFILEFMRDLLSRKGHRVVSAEDGLSALDVLESFTPEVIFTDLVMPNIEGRKLCKIIRNMKKLGRVPIVVLSSILAEEGLDAEKLGVNACISKGSLDKMTRHILRVLEDLDVEVSKELSEEIIEIERSRPRAITEELLSRKRHLEVILESMSEGILEIAPNGRIIYANPAALSLTGLAEEELLGSRMIELFSEKDQHQVRRLLASMDDSPRTIKEEAPVRLNKYQVIVNVFPVSADRPTAIVILNDISERKRAEEMHRSERDKFLGVLNAIGESVFIVNRDFVVEYQNKVAENHFGDVIGGKCHSVYMQNPEPCDFCRIDETVSSGKAQYSDSVDQEGRSYDIVFSPFMDVNGEIKMIVLKRDITERKRLLAETMRSAHLASLGELSAGVAHEINNPINGIINYAEILRDRYQEQGKDPEIPTRIIKEGERISHIVGNLLSFARSNKDEPDLAHVKDVFSAAIDLVEEELVQEGIKVDVQIPSDLPAVNVRSEEIQQVFLNLLSNARYALNQRFPGSHSDKTLDVIGGTVEVDGVSYVRLTFCDRGTGIPAKQLDKICNPFFSTKSKGEGTGLGLSICHGIVKQHGGRLWFESEEGAYTKAVVDLPRAFTSKTEDK